MSERRNSHAREEFILNNGNPDRQNDLLYIEQAGITHPDPSYYIRRTRQLRCFDYLYVLEYVVSGKGYIECDGVTYAVQAGDFYFLNRGIEPCYYADAERPFEKLWLNIAGGFMNLMTASYQLDMPVLVCHFGHDPGIGRIHDILRCTESPDACQPDVLRVLIDLFEQIKENRIAQASGESLFADICKKVERELCFPLNIDQLAHDFYISRSTLYRLFMTNCGLSPKKYILGRKIELARRLLRRNLQSIEEIALMLQFADVKHFGRVFRAHTGVTPAAYRFGLGETSGEQAADGRSMLWLYSTIDSRSSEPFAWKAVGMGFVLRTSAGRFVVVDGGRDKDAGPLISLMQREAGDRRPEVALWIITHPHSDHAGVLQCLSEEPYLKRQIRIHAIAMQIPEQLPHSKGEEFVNGMAILRTVAERLGCASICPHSGERLEADDLTVEFFFTPEDKAAEEVNDLSMVFRISGAKRSVMFCGDAYSRTLSVVNARYDEARLHSDMIQAAHHGLDGGDAEFYRRVGASTVFAPMSRPAYAAMTAGKFSEAEWTRANRHLMQGAKRLYLSADGEVGLPLDE